MESKIVKHNGKNYIAVVGKVVDSLSMKTFRPTENNIGDFYKAGVPTLQVYCSNLTSALGLPYSLFGETWFGDKDYNFDNLDKQIEFFKENAPGTYLFVNLHVDSRKWWHDENPGRPSSFTHLSQIAADEKWREDTADYIRAAISHMEEKYNDIIIGYFLLGGFTTEWFSEDDHEEGHPIKLAAYKKYMNDENAVIPDVSELKKDPSQVFLDPVADKNLISYRKFHHNLIADTVLYYCHEAQKALCHKKVLGIFYGYIMELDGTRIWDRGHIETDKVYRSSDIDLIATPSSYQFRGYDDACANMLLCDTLELDGMMYYCSFDHMTFTVPNLDNNKRRLCLEKNTMDAMTRMSIYRKDILKTRKQTTDAMRRELMQRLSKRTGMWWFDMLEGWFYDDGLMEEVASNVKKSASLVDRKAESASEIAVFVSCESLYYVNKVSEINTECLCNQRDALARMGAPYDIYSLGDIDRINPDKYKLFIFPDAYYLTEEQRQCINAVIKKNGRSVLFVGACDYASDTELSLERVCDLTEMNIKKLAEDENTINCLDSTYGYVQAKTPTLYVEDKNTEILGRYSMSRKCAVAKKKVNDYTIYYSGLGNLSDVVLREIAREAGVHIYTENAVACYVNTLVYGVYNTKNEETTITLPFDGEFTELFSDIVYKTKDKKIVLPTGENPAQMLVLSKKD